LLPIATANLDSISEFIRALATLAWPAAAITFVLIFRKQVEGLFGRLTKGKILGQELEFSERLDQLEDRATEAEQDPAIPIASSSTDADAAIEREVQAILREAATSPKVALMALSAELERRIRQLSAARGADPGARPRTPRQMLSELPEIPDTLRGAIDEFWNIRNRIVHGAAATDAEALRALDSGLAILRALERVPVEENYVEDPNVPLFADAVGNEPRDDVHGVLLRTVAPEGGEVTFRIFPTTRTHFERGKQVAWEWNSKAKWGPTWYRDPQTGQLEPAWSGSLEFIGRHLDDV
jgi:hypothetical protein